MSWTNYTVYNFADDLHWPELGILLESIDYHEAARKASFLGSMCEDSLMAAIHFERRFDALMKYVINSQEHPIGKQFLPQDVAFSIHLSDNRFTARPLSTTVVSPPRKWAPWVDIGSPQPASARFFAKCPLRACALYIPSLNNWQLTEVDGRAVKWVRRTVV